MTKVIVQFDGSCIPNRSDGIASYGTIIKQNDIVLYKAHGKVTPSPIANAVSCNMAEYEGIIAALTWLLENGHKDSEILVRGASKLVIEQLKGNWAIKAQMMQWHYRRAMRLVSQFPHIALARMPREYNWEAHNLAQKAYREQLTSLLAQSSYYT